MGDGWRGSKAPVMIATDTVAFYYSLLSRQTREIEKVVAPRLPAASPCLVLQPCPSMLFNSPNTVS